MTSKEFSNGHTHIKSLKAGIRLINFEIYKKIPNRSGYYYLTSLQRISKDKIFIKKIEEFKQARANKGSKQKYYNQV